jgi:uncharacterized protein YeeX (DUF496 family)
MDINKITRLRNTLTKIIEDNEKKQKNQNKWTYLFLFCAK